jgi:4-hydroxybenzoate polyprenyltransferase
MKITHFFNLIRWKNLLLITYVFFLIKFVLFTNLNTITNISNLQFIVYWLTIILITAAGNIINDIYDVEIDKINKPNTFIIGKYLEVSNAKKWYLTLNIFGNLAGIIFSISINKPFLFLIFIGTSLLLHWYSKYLKSKPLLGNFLIAFLISFSIVLIAILDINYQVKSINQIFTILFIYILAIFSFFINLLREIIKDVEDIKGDYKLKMNTLPILFGINRTLKLAFSLSLIPVFLLMLIILKLDNYYLYFTIYITIGCLIPLLYISLKLWKLKSYKKIHSLSVFLKIIMFLGINSIIIISLIEK